eukprot:TRINITY_DN2519_c0_g1_i3.p2 TRINITY_DN2519_c0_g1~~TRINITY_DN2519_c0_g1_i3.p2  ORF type:complete len:112 (-),score=25.04 TRINITY_DN2519_c0_g1_i3:230-565(-)
MAARRTPGSDPSRKYDNILQRNMEEDNDKAINALTDKISELKSISIGIRDYMQNEKNQLGKLEKDYDSSSSMMDQTMKKLNALMNMKHGRMAFYLIGFVVFFLVILYILPQ